MTDHGRVILIQETKTLIEDAKHILQQLENGADKVYTASSTLCTLAMSKGFEFDVGVDPADNRRKFNIYQPSDR